MKYILAIVACGACSSSELHHLPPVQLGLIDRVKAAINLHDTDPQLAVEYRRPGVFLRLATSGKYELRYHYQLYTGFALPSRSAGVLNLVLDSSIFLRDADSPETVNIFVIEDKEFDVSLWTRLDDGPIPSAFNLFIDELVKNSTRP